ncbi:hypothetical protein JRQ81_016374 [Phrynocephalus forsythii]|uniref:ATP-dependent RNA helicase n=1 Tax=Phrynocephalus forsythii TaxID=171643 RepID=A0A9Q1B1E6_9SAUR|nr:hypothetical protein JRQ81_016374 [Phrynocephalus forsythii]
MENLKKKNNDSLDEKEADDNDGPALPLGLTGAFEDTPFASLCDLVSENTLEGITDMYFTHMTEIQHKSIKPLQEARHILAAAKTGSGKTLVFLILPIEPVFKLKFMPRNGAGVFILSPTQELAMHTYGILKELMTLPVHTYGLVMGDSNRSAEAQKIANGINIVAPQTDSWTPCRICQGLWVNIWSVWSLMMLTEFWKLDLRRK